MKAICEAPGKIIIAGEHFVVHGAYALAAAIGKKVRAEAAPSEKLAVQSTGSKNPAGLLPVVKSIRGLYARRGRDPRVALRIISEIPNASGLGSSASTMVASVGAVCKLEGWSLDQESLIRHAMVGEIAIHGRPSGIDPTVSAMGGVILFKMRESPRRIRVGHPTEIVVIQSGIKRETGKLISRVSALGDEHPDFFSGLCESVSCLSRLAARKLTTGDLPELGKLMTCNHAVLGRVGASNATLDKIVDLCLGSGCLGAKLTGAGGGGSVIAIPGRGGGAATLRAARDAGYDGFVSAIPNGGARAWLEN